MDIWHRLLRLLCRIHYYHQIYSGGENFVYILQRFRNHQNRTYARSTPAGKILYILQRFRNRRNRNYARCTTAGKILYILQRFRNPRHRNCDSCTMAETYRIYYSGIVYHPPSHLRRRKTYSGEDVMLAGIWKCVYDRIVYIVKKGINIFSKNFKRICL